MIRLLIFAVAPLLVFACSPDDDAVPASPEFAYDFSTDAEGWMGDFADYPVGAEEQYELDFGYATLPEPLDTREGALRQSGINGSDDLFMFVKRKLTGLEPNRTYAATFSVRLATNVADGTVGIGGSPGTSVFVKAGLATSEPTTVRDDLDHYRLTLDKGNQATEGEDAIILGDLANGTPEDTYVLKELTNATPFAVQADANGELWFFVGTDSGFEGRTTVYYDAITVDLR
ncbi:hypothetical protein [Lewinella sp. IMCC34183]|uniref:hypothetical protein n=1 Tax=Lewinella sp. IMCC34183 TaxID=2248762 RepID=UPI000E27539F|nr:hypothetical protein [Lewinella sp. IMCC34183]